MTNRFDTDPETLALVRAVDPLNDPRVAAGAGLDTDAALRAVLTEVHQRSARSSFGSRPRRRRRRALKLGAFATAAAAASLLAVNVGSSGDGQISSALRQAGVGVAPAQADTLLARARHALTAVPSAGAIQEVIQTAGKTYDTGPRRPGSRSETWTELRAPYNSRTVFDMQPAQEEGQTNGQFEFFDPSTNTIYRETDPYPQQQAGGDDPALAPRATALKLLRTPGVTLNRTATVNGGRAIEVTSKQNSHSITKYWFSPTTYQPLQYVEEDPGLGQFTAVYNKVTTLTGAAASPALVSIAAQHPSATITDLPNHAFVAKQEQVQGG